MDIVRDTAKHLQMDATKGVSTNSVEGLAPVSDAPGPYARQESISLSGVGEVPVQCLENLATQVNHAVQGSAYGSPAKRGDSVAEVQVDAKMMDGGAEGEAGPRLSPLIVNTSPEKRAHGEGSPSASALEADSSNVSAGESWIACISFRCLYGNVCFDCATFVKLRTNLAGVKWQVK
jgi:hypothetical protein